MIATNMGIGGENLANPRFLLYSKVVMNKTNIVPGISAGFSVFADVYFFVGDAFEKTIFSSYVIPVKGYGNSLESALIEALKSIKTNDEKFNSFLINGISKINEYFKNQCPLIINRAKSLASEQKYDEAIFNLYSVPESSTNCHTEATALIKNIYGLKINEESSKNLRKAKLIWAGSQSASSIKEILATLEQVNPSSSSFKEVDQFISDINKKIENNITRDWLEKQEIRKQELEKEKIRLELEKSQIEASKQIAIAYASGTYITNNYTANSYSSSYSPSYYTTRIYDTLIW
jgi:hypothetical protein